MKFIIGREPLDSRSLYRCYLDAGLELELSEEGLKKVEITRAQVAHVAKQKTYGINTGFGLLADVTIAEKDLETLQKNIVLSHAAGVGEPFEEGFVRALGVVKIATQMLGFSGLRKEIVQWFASCLNKKIYPVVPCQGSVGASGDLAPLSHFALPLIGEGEVFYKGKRYPAREILEKENLSPLKLEKKEGLALINGTQVLTTLAAIGVAEAHHVLEAAVAVSAMSLSLFKGTLKAFDERIHALKPHEGQVKIAQAVRGFFKQKDEIMESHENCDKVQDAYSFRCIPQVYGAVFDALQYVEKTVNTELLSVTDNPLVFAGGIISGGNFHGQSVAQAADFLAIAMTTLSNLSERRIEKFTNPAMCDLPAFLAQNPGLESGFMIPQVTAASLVSENKTLSHPASVDSIPTSADKEDHVSMGVWAGRKLRQVVRNTAHVVAIEAMIGMRAVTFRRPLKMAPPLEEFLRNLQGLAPDPGGDHPFGPRTEKIAEAILRGKLSTKEVVL